MIEPLPAAVLELLRAKRRKSTPPRATGEGGRNNALASHLGKLRHGGAGEEELRKAATDFNAALEVPLDEREVEGVVQSILRYPPGAERGDAVMAELNGTHAIVKLGAKVRVLEERDGELSFLPPSEFKAYYANRFVSVEKRQRTIADYWFSHPQRRQYERIDFLPGCEAPPGVYNVWRGWGVKASPHASCQFFLAHLRDNICHGSELLFLWVLGWFAQIFQKPMVKLGTALVLRGPQGTGKTIVGQVFGRLLGPAYRHVASGRMVTGQFNHHMEGCLLLHADEAFWAGDKASEGVLKDLVTSDTLWIERKGIEAVQSRNCVRLFVASNSDWVIPAGLEERRFATLDVGTASMQNAAYFGRMFDELEAGGYEALLYMCLTTDLTQIDLRTIPATMALHEQKLASLKPEEAWFVDLLQSGTLPGDTEGTGLVVRVALYNSFYAHAQNIGVRRRSIATIVGIYLKKTVLGLRRTEETNANGDTVGCYQFPPLATCRTAFGKAMGGYDDWGEPTEWQASPAQASDKF